MGRVKEQLFDAEQDAEVAAWVASPEGRAAKEEAIRAQAATDDERARRERVWAVRNPDEWSEWLRLQPLLVPIIDFGGDMRFDFDDFLMEVGRRPSANHVVVRRDDERPYQQENLAWACKQVEPPRSPYLNVEEAAAYLGVAVQTIYNNSKHIPRLPGFRNLMYDPKVLDAVRASARFKSKRRSSPR